MLYDNAGNEMLCSDWKVNLGPDTKESRKAIKDYVQGAVDVFVKNNCDKPFSVRDLFGGMNNNWNGTPLQVLYNVRVSRGSKCPKESAARDVGRILKKILSDDTRRKYQMVPGYGNHYKFVGKL